MWIQNHADLKPCRYKTSVFKTIMYFVNVVTFCDGKNLLLILFVGLFALNVCGIQLHLKPCGHKTSIFKTIW